MVTYIQLGKAYDEKITKTNYESLVPTVNPHLTNKNTKRYRLKPFHSKVQLIESSVKQPMIAPPTETLSESTTVTQSLGRAKDSVKLWVKQHIIGNNNENIWFWFLVLFIFCVLILTFSVRTHNKVDQLLEELKLLRGFMHFRTQ